MSLSRSTFLAAALAATGALALAPSAYAQHRGHAVVHSSRTVVHTHRAAARPAFHRSVVVHRRSTFFRPGHAAFRSGRVFVRRPGVRVAVGPRRGWWWGGRPWGWGWGYPWYGSGYTTPYALNDYGYEAPTYVYPPVNEYEYSPEGEVAPGYMPPADTAVPDETEAPAETPEEQPAAGAAPATVEVLLPSPTALVWFNDHATKQTGAVRNFTTPPLEPGQDYHYEVTASWRQGGKTVTARRTATVSAGGAAVVNFRQAAGRDLPKVIPAPAEPR
jgi:uncharacterized protein (TIGR03000 family)